MEHGTETKTSGLAPYNCVFAYTEMLVRVFLRARAHEYLCNWELCTCSADFVRSGQPVAGMLEGGNREQ